MKILRTAITHNEQEFSFLLSEANLKTTTGEIAGYIPVVSTGGASLRRANGLTIPGAQITGLSIEEFTRSQEVVDYNVNQLRALGDDFPAFCEQFGITMISAPSGVAVPAAPPTVVAAGQRGTARSQTGTMIDVEIVSVDGEFVTIVNHSMSGSPQMEVELARFDWTLH